MTLPEVAEALARTMEAAVSAHENRGKVGMQVPFHGDFANAPPSCIGRFRWWARELRAALGAPVGERGRRAMADEERIDITPLYDESDEMCELLARGHADRAAFAAEANREFGHHSGGIPFTESDVEHEWRRAVPDPSGGRMCIYHPAVAGSRGAFKATTIDLNYPAGRAPGSEAKGGQEP